MKLKVFEAFSGIGAQHTAFKRLQKRINIDFEIVGTSDWDIYAVQSYAAIHHPGYDKSPNPSQKELDYFLKNYTLSADGKVPIKNINTLSKEKLINIYKAFKISNNIGSIVNSFERIRDDILIKHKNIDFLTYSFPCQDLSLAGNFHGFNEGIKSHTRSGLLFEIEKLLENFIENKYDLPKYLLLENVVNLVQEKHKHSFDNWINKLTKIGYKTIWGILDSSDFGMLQGRKRVFALSIFDQKNKYKRKNMERDDFAIILKEIFENKYKPKNIQKINKIFDFDNIFFEESVLSQMKNTPSRVKMYEQGKKIDINFSNKIPTITTKQDRWPNSGNVYFYNNRIDKDGIEFLNRRFITPRESYYLMGYNKIEYNRAQKQMNISCVSKRNARDKLNKQAGNSIAINCLEMVFYYMLKDRNKNGF